MTAHITSIETLQEKVRELRDDARLNEETGRGSLDEKEEHGRATALNNVLDLLDRFGEKSYMATSTSSWGRGFTEDSAIEYMALNHETGQGDVPVTVCEVIGEAYSPSPGTVVADEIVEETEYLFDGESMDELHELMNRVEILTEELFVEAEEITGLTAKEIEELKD